VAVNVSGKEGAMITRVVETEPPQELKTYCSLELIETLVDAISVWLVPGNQLKVTGVTTATLSTETYPGPVGLEVIVTPTVF
jgi:hypothetical protein